MAVSSDFHFSLFPKSSFLFVHILPDLLLCAGHCGSARDAVGGEAARAQRASQGDRVGLGGASEQTTSSAAGREGQAGPWTLQPTFTVVGLRPRKLVIATLARTECREEGLSGREDLDSSLGDGQTVAYRAGLVARVGEDTPLSTGGVHVRS